ncbi:rab-GTPase-TBC domain-containing protein [Globomyces pollinis-pini]|nr:rab-GTPase-TBC domain-containing protein [Globomyces pollinis-pini]
MEFRTTDRVALFELYVYAQNLPPENTFDNFRKLCFNGVPDKMRPMVWKILMNHLPFDERGNWESIQTNFRTNYYGLICQFLRNPKEEEIIVLKSKDVGSTTSKWKSLFHDAELMEQIDKDVRRTFPDMAFFQLPVKASSICPLYAPYNVLLMEKRHCIGKWLRCFNSDSEVGGRKRQNSIPMGSVEILEYHWEVMLRILYIYCKVNAGIGYVQGMNNLIAPIYFVLANDSDENNRAHAEADTFFIFNSIMCEIKDLFTRSLDEIGLHSEPNSHENVNKMPVDMSSFGYLIPEQAKTRGIGDTMERLMKQLQKYDFELWDDLVTVKQLDGLFFAFRWISVMFTQEFSLPDCLRIWDSIFAEVFATPCLTPASLQQVFTARPESGVLDFLIQFSCAMLLSVKQELLAGDFSENMQLLQHYPLDVEIVFEKVRELRIPEKTFISEAKELLEMIPFKLNAPKDGYKWV